MNEDLAAREARLRALNDQLETRRQEVVSKAQALIKEQQTTGLREPTRDTKPVCPDPAAAAAMVISDEPLEAKQEDPQGELDEEEHNAALEDIRLEAEIVGATKISAPAQVKLHKARYKALEKEFHNLAEVLRVKDKEMMELGRTRELVVGENKRLTRQLQSANLRASKADRKSEEAVRELSVAKKELSDAQRKLRELQKLGKEHNTTKRHNDLRLNRALEEAEKAKTELLKARKTSQADSKNRIEKIGRTQEEVKILRKQKKQLITAFKKQMKLIDVLKRQKLHMQAMKQLQFSEESFLKIIREP